MERLREDLIRRARMERRGGLEQESSGGDEVVTGGVARPQQRPRLLPFLNRPVIHQRNPVLQELETLHQPTTEPEPPVSPKEPVDDRQGRDGPLNRFSLPSISRFWPGGSRTVGGRESQTRPDPAGETYPPSPQGEVSWDAPSPPEPVTHARMSFRAASSRYSSDEVPVEAGPHPSRRGASDGRRRRRQRQRSTRGTRRHRVKPPERFLCCLPWVKSRRARAYIVRCLVSGFILVLLLTVYLSLSMSNMIELGGFTIVFVLIVVLTTLFFCYGLMKICLIAVRKDRQARLREEQRLEEGYAVPVEPIRVILARDEEAAGLDDEVSKVTPPAYGIWRESVRVDPNLLYWQRSESAGDTDRIDRPGTSDSHRPPSYISDDGVSYVVHAEPRSVAPSSIYSELPVHPSEVGRVSLPRSPR